MSKDCRDFGTTRLPENAFMSLEDLSNFSLTKAQIFWKPLLNPLFQKYIRQAGQVAYALDRINEKSRAHSAKKAIMDSLDELVKKESLKKEEFGVVESSRCLLSFQEAATFIERGTTSQRLIAAVREIFLDSKFPDSIDSNLRELGVRGIRECFDILRRWQIANTIALDLQVERSAVFAYWRQEGAFCVSPPASSFEFAPVINTDKKGSCRTPCVNFSADGRRDGFNLSVANTARLPDMPGLTPLFRFIIANASLLTLGGLDQLCVPLVSEKDELWLFIKAAIKAKNQGALSRLNYWATQEFVDEFAAEFLKSSLNDFEKKKESAADAAQRFVRAIYWRFVETMVGIASLNLEISMEVDLPPFLVPSNAPKTNVKGAKKLLSNTVDRFIGLLTSHIHLMSSDQKMLFLKSDEEARETLQVIYTGYQLLEIKRSVHTLAAFRDREQIPKFEPMSDFMMYLRFHLGDALFVSYLIRVAAHLQRIKLSRVFKKDTAFMKAVSKVKDLPIFVAKTKILVHGLKEFNSSRVVMNRLKMKETVWRHIGLLDKLRAASDPPDWLPKAPKPSKELENAAITVREFLHLLNEHKALDAIESFLSESKFTELHILLTTKKMVELFPSSDITRAFAPISKAHSFTRLKGTIAEAFQDGEVRDIPTKVDAEDTQQKAQN